jgi:predicted porin
MFKRATLLYSILATASSIVCAQAASPSQVTIYGIIDTGVEFARSSGGPGAARVASVASGSNAASRLGFNIHEDLGGGMYAGARLETGLESDTGANSSAVYFNRASFVKLGGAWGEVRLGRDYTPGFYVLQQGDINGLNLYGNAGTFTQLGPSAFTRSGNAINYVSPELMHTVIRATYSLGLENSAPPKDAGRLAAISAVFNNKTVLIGAYYQRRSDVFPAGSTTTQHATSTGVAGRWNSGAFSVGAGAARWDPAGPDTAASGEVRSWWLGASVKSGVGEFRAQGGQLRRSSPGAIKPEATLYAVSYLHPLSKRTTLYATYGTLKNNDAANFRLEASSRTVALPAANDVDTKGLALGITHRF